LGDWEMFVTGRRRSRGMLARNAKLVVRYTADENAVVRARAIAARCPLAVYIREASLGQTPRPTAGIVNAEAIRALAFAGNALRELTKSKSISAVPDLTSQAESAIAAILDAIASLRAQRKRGAQ
jgi:hypothetical protein